MKKKFLSIPAILLLLLLFVFYGTTYARSWTSNEVETTLNQICNAYPNYNQSIWVKRLLNSNAWNEQKNNIPFDQYNELIIRIYEESSVKRYVDFIPTNYDGTFTVASGGNVTTSKSETNTGYRFNSLSSSQTYIGTLDRTITSNWLNVKSDSYGGCVLLVDNTIYNSNNLVVLGLQQSATMVVPYTTTYVDNNEQYRLGEGFIGDYYNYQDIEYRIYNDNGNEIEDYVLQATQVNNGYNVNVYINTSNIISGRTYYIDLYYNNTLLFQYGYGNTLIINENSGNASGDKSGDIIIDLTETNEKLENIIGIMEEQQETMNILTGQESGEKAETFWNNLYNNLFTLESGDVEEIVNTFVESSNLGEYGLESGELAILNVLNGEPSDFVISWNSVIIPNLKDNTPTQLIPAGSINFSKVSVTLGSESYTLSEEKLNQFMIIIGWVQLIMGVSVVILTIANVWETLMRALGVGVGMYEDNADEHSTIVNVGEDGTMRTTEIVRTPTKGRIWYIHKKY